MRVPIDAGRDLYADLGSRPSCRSHAGRDLYAGLDRCGSRPSCGSHAGRDLTAVYGDKAESSRGQKSVCV